MNKNTKLIVTVIALAAILIIAALAYKSLSAGYSQPIGGTASSVQPSPSVESASTESQTSALPQESVEPLTSASPQASASATASEEEKIAAPDFTVYDANGNAVKLSDFLGKPVIINFWTSWCPYCIKEMPYFEDAYQSSGSDIQIMMIDVMDNETPESGQAFIAESGFTFPVFYDNDLEASYAFGIQSYPTTVFIDKDGNVAAGVSGAIDQATLAKGIALIK